jgi:hypothetical protein
VTRILGACGLLCSECEAYKASQAEDAAAIAKVAVDWSQRYGGDIKPESVWCDGCLTSGARKCGHTKECEIRACSAGRGIANCAPCSDYGCEKIAGLHKMVPEAKTALDAVRSGRSQA